MIISGHNGFTPEMSIMLMRPGRRLHGSHQVCIGWGWGPHPAGCGHSVVTLRPAGPDPRHNASLTHVLCFYCCDKNHTGETSLAG